MIANYNCINNIQYCRNNILICSYYIMTYTKDNIISRVYILNKSNIISIDRNNILISSENN